MLRVWWDEEKKALCEEQIAPKFHLLFIRTIDSSKGDDILSVEWSGTRTDDQVKCAMTTSHKRYDGDKI